MKELSQDIYDLAHSFARKSSGLKSAHAKMKMRKAVRQLLLISSDLGWHEASYALALVHLRGWGGKRDYKSAVKYLKMSVKAANAEAMFNLGICYETGHGAKRNVNSAFKMYLAGAKQGDPACIFEVGRCLYHGIGTKVNKERAETFLRRAEDLKKRKQKVRNVTRLGAPGFIDPH
jgi:uncharacterized protein